MNAKWKARNKTKFRLAVNHVDAIQSALAVSINGKKIVQEFLHTHPQKGMDVDTIRTWCAHNIHLDKAPLKKALTKLYADSYVLGQDIANDVLDHLTAKKVLGIDLDKATSAASGVNWSDWTAGNRAAGLLLKPPNGLHELMSSRNVMLMGLDKTTTDRIGTQLSYALDRGLAPSTAASNVESIIVAATGRDINAMMSDPERAMMIAQTEMSRAVSVASREQYTDANVEEVEWLVADGCDICVENADASPLGIDETFPSGDTEPPAHPNCFTGETLVTGSALQGAVSRFYEGEVVELSFSQGQRFTVTPNHPILTPNGWIAAGLLNQGDKVIAERRFKRSAVGDVYNDKTPTRIGDVVNSFGGSSGVATREVPVARPDFHNDGGGSKVAVVYANSRLSVDGYTALSEQVSDFDFIGTRADISFLPSVGALEFFFDRVLASPLGDIGFLRNLFAFIFGHIDITRGHVIALSSLLKSILVKSQDNSSSADAVPLRQLLDGRAPEVRFDDFANWQVNSVLSSARRNFSGHVFNLQTARNFYSADGIIAHNCMCDLAPYLVVDNSTQDVPVEDNSGDGTDAATLAEDLYSIASALEPALTETMQSVADSLNVELSGLQYRLKSVDSLVEKITKDATDKFGGDMTLATQSVKDSLRYTMISDSSQYTKTVDKALKLLKKEGWDTKRVTNTWTKGADYKGINVNLSNSTGHIIELQFHTPESLDVKGVNHLLYEDWRKLSPSSTEAKAIFDKMVANSEALVHPK